MRKLILSSIVFIIRLYQIFISPFKMQCCKFVPSCSKYSICAFQSHGLFKGLYLSLNRIIRCNPLNKKNGYDPVPIKKTIS
ncbi:membrane protein insertion efficiency factor YidD [Ichthyobacterium seriolicida]|uniref:membrane protein insertion efficiency factor YidD n=1 Tax=Ichthyobacterium seriolicida TaxID=242600 RepID=UPI000BBCF52C|nr:membrane protein insertion efficiency factor YidD [Ichthyobacterium seriolicida]